MTYHVVPVRYWLRGFAWRRWELWAWGFHAGPVTVDRAR